MWLLFAFGSALFAGLTSILAKIGIKNISSNAATALRTFVVLVFSWLMVLVTGSWQSLSDIPLRSLLFLALSGLATGGSWLFYFKALSLGDVNKVTPVDKSSTVLTMLLAFLVLGEPITLYKGIGMALIAVGTYLMIAKKKDTAEKKTHGLGWLACAALSAALAALTAILGKIGVEGINSTLATALRTIVVLVMAWVVVFVTGEQKQLERLEKRDALFLVLSGIATGASWLCYYRALQDGEASVVVPIDKLSILVTIAFAAVFLNERLSKKAAVGLTLLTAGTLTLLL